MKDLKPPPKQDDDQTQSGSELKRALAAAEKFMDRYPAAMKRLAQ